MLGYVDVPAQRFLDAGAQYVHVGPDEFKARMLADVKSIEDVVRAGGISAD